MSTLEILRVGSLVFVRTVISTQFYAKKINLKFQCDAVKKYEIGLLCREFTESTRKSTWIRLKYFFSLSKKVE